MIVHVEVFPTPFPGDSRCAKEQCPNPVRHTVCVSYAKTDIATRWCSFHLARLNLDAVRLLLNAGDERAVPDALVKGA